MRQFITIAVIGFIIAVTNARSYESLRNRYRCYSQAAVRTDCSYGQILDNNGCRLDRCYKSCTEEIYCNQGYVSKRVNGRCVCEDSATVCPANDCDFRTAEDLLINPPCDKFLVDQKTGCEICECDCRQHGGECRDMNCAHGQLHRDDGCRLCECRTCDELDCDVDCEFGYKKDVFGCDTCTCNPNPRCPEKTCEYGFKKDRNGRSTCDCACAPECSRDCPYGFEKDDEGCPLCRCACPPMDNCNLDCEFGYYEERGCSKCQCKPHPRCPSLECEFGYKKDRNGNSLCECKHNPKCPDLYCEFGFEKHSDGYSLCECKPNPQCPDLECSFGYKKDNAGNSICQCLPNPDCPNKSCSRGFVLDKEGIPICECKCGPVCLINCQYGNVLDGEDCPTCKCKPPPCPICRKNCKYGYHPGSNGCDSCDCKPAPLHEGHCPRRQSNEGELCDDDGDCDHDEKCCSKHRGHATCQKAVTESPHGGKCPHFILLDLTKMARDLCYSDNQCDHREKCCNVGGVRRCVTTGVTGVLTGTSHYKTGTRRAGYSRH